MNDLQLLHRAVCAAPADNTARLVYADCLEESGDSARAEFVRTQVELSQLAPPPEIEMHSISADGRSGFVYDMMPRLRVGHYRRFRHGGNEVDAVVTRVGDGENTTHTRYIEFERKPYPYWNEYKKLRARESALLASHWHLWHSNPQCSSVACMNLAPAQRVRGTHGASDGVIDVRFERGFLSSLTCTAAVFLANADALLWNPEQTIEGELSYEERAQFACKVCGNVPDEFGGIEHGKGCYTQGENGGGSSYVELPECRVPRPCPPTAQPITRVTLTTESELSFTCVGDGGWTNARFPGVKFSLPQGAQVNLTPHTLHGMIRIPDELLNPQLLPTQADEQRADLAEAWVHAERAANARYETIREGGMIRCETVPPDVSSAFVRDCECAGDGIVLWEEPVITDFHQHRVYVNRQSRIRTRRGNYFVAFDGQCSQCRRVYVAIAPALPPVAEVPRTGWLVEKLTPRFLEEARDAAEHRTYPPFYVKSTPSATLRLYFTPPPGTRFDPKCEGTKLRDVTGFDRSGNAFRFAEIIITRTNLAHVGPRRDNGIEIEAESCGAFEVVARS